MSNLNWEFYICLPPKLIALLGALSDYDVKVMKPLYDVSEAGNESPVYHLSHIL